MNGLNQPLETPSGQTSIGDCVRGMNKKLKDQLIMKFQLAHFTAIHGKPFTLYSNYTQFILKLYSERMSTMLTQVIAT